MTSLHPASGLPSCNQVWELGTRGTTGCRGRVSALRTGRGFAARPAPSLLCEQKPLGLRGRAAWLDTRRLASGMSLGLCHPAQRPPCRPIHPQDLAGVPKTVRDQNGVAVTTEGASRSEEGQDERALLSILIASSGKWVSLKSSYRLAGLNNGPKVLGGDRSHRKCPSYWWRGGGCRHIITDVPELHGVSFGFCEGLSTRSQNPRAPFSLGLMRTGGCEGRHPGLGFDFPMCSGE